MSLKSNKIRCNSVTVQSAVASLLKLCTCFHFHVYAIISLHYSRQQESKSCKVESLQTHISRTRVHSSLSLAWLAAGIKRYRTKNYYKHTSHTDVWNSLSLVWQVARTQDSMTQNCYKHTYIRTPSTPTPPPSFSCKRKRWRGFIIIYKL